MVQQRHFHILTRDEIIRQSLGAAGYAAHQAQLQERERELRERAVREPEAKEGA